MAKAPAFQMYAADFLIDVSEFSNEEVGAYTRLLMTQWVNGDLPSELSKLANVAVTDQETFKKIWKTISVNFQLNDKGRYVNPRLEKTRSDKKQFSLKASENGTAGAEIKKGKEQKPIVFPYDGSIKFIQQWDIWKQYKVEQHRFKFKSSISEQASIDGIVKLAVDENEAIELIKHAIEKSWQGIYKPGNWNYGQQTSNKQQTGGGKSSYDAGAINNLHKMSEGISKT